MNDKPYVIIINPPRFNGKNVRRDERSADILENEVSPFYQGAVMAQYLRLKRQAEVKVLDANGLDCDFTAVEEWIKENNQERGQKIAIIKAADDTLEHDARVLALAKKFGFTTLLWEPILSPALPEKIYAQINQPKKILDYIILNEAELTVNDFLIFGESARGLAYADENGRLVINQRRSNEIITDLNELPIPDFNDLPVKNYQAWFGEGPWMTLFTSRGCIGQCQYCLIGGSTVNRGYGRPVRLQSPERVLEEIEILVKKFGVKHITFWDDCFTLQVQRVKEICQLIIEKKLKFRWSCMSRVDLIDYSLLKLMKKAGLKRIGFGVESGSQRILDSIPKRTTVAQNLQAIKTCKKLGIWVWIYLIIGLPEENWESIKETLRFVTKAKPDYIFMGCATPFPGTQYYEECQKFGLLPQDISESIVKEGIATGSKAKARSRYLSEAELTKAEFLVHRAFVFSSPKIIFNKLLENRGRLNPNYILNKIKFFIRKNYEDPSD